MGSLDFESTDIIRSVLDRRIGIHTVQWVPLPFDLLRWQEVFISNADPDSDANPDSSAPLCGASKRLSAVVWSLYIIGKIYDNR